MCAKRRRYRIDEFAEMVHPRDGHRKIFAMIDAYLDESGIHKEASVCVIAGYFAGRGKWKRFEDDWRQLLADFNVPMERFHAKNFFRNAKDGFSLIGKATIRNSWTASPTPSRNTTK